MIICLCKSVSDRKIRELADQGASYREVVHQSQAGTCCGACTLDVQDIIKRCRRPSPERKDDQDS